jgi:hypothetical protein
MSLASLSSRQSWPGVAGSRRISIDEQAAIPFAGTWAVPLEAEFVTRAGDPVKARR